MKQWWEMKSQYYDTILFFKMGKFYELFHMDAIVGIEKFGLKIMRVSNQKKGTANLVLTN